MIRHSKRQRDKLPTDADASAANYIDALIKGRDPHQIVQETLGKGRETPSDMAVRERRLQTIDDWYAHWPACKEFRK